MNKPIGQIIEERINAQNVNVTEFAKNIGTERTNVYNIFKRETIDTGLLKKIGRELHYDFFQDLLEPETIKEIVLRHSITNRVFVELELTEEDVLALGLEDRVVKKLINSE